MKQQKRYEDHIRTDLYDRGLYDTKKERLITVAARCQKFIDMMEDELSRHSMTLYQTGSMGQTKITQHPHVESIRKFNATLAYCLVHLGLSDDENKEIGVQETVLDTFLRSLE